ncbi:MAG: DNA polymerase III subunit delta' [Candidatus Cloacimonetes bacterium]|nr:DNA polymerase III subunit delta' [Candidatus Cloacimonadota bacterium]
MFTRIRGQQRAVELLQRALRDDRTAHSYLFHGPQGVGKVTAALALGMAHNCLAPKLRRPCGECNSCRKFITFNHPDLLYIFPTPNLSITPEREIKDKALAEQYEAYLENRRKHPWREFLFTSRTGIRLDMIRMLQHHVIRTPLEGRFKVYIIEDAETMGRQAANAFLKTLEEPPADTRIILTTTRPHLLLQTILSRCQKVPFQPLTRQIIETELIENRSLENIEAKTYARIAGGNMEKALRLVEEGHIEARQLAIEFVEILIAQDDNEFLDFLERSHQGKVHAVYDELLTYLAVWLADVGLYKDDPDQIANIDKTHLFDHFYAHRVDADELISDLLDTLDGLRRRLRGNVNPRLVLTRVYHILGEAFGFSR